MYFNSNLVCPKMKETQICNGGRFVGFLAPILLLKEISNIRNYKPHAV